MSLSYTLLGTIVGILILFIYLVWLYVSSKYVWNKSESEVAGKIIKEVGKILLIKKIQFVF